MAQIRCGLEDGLSKEQIAIYAKPDLDFNQMAEIRAGLENGLSMEQVKSYAKPEINDKQMNKMRQNIENGKANQPTPEPVKDAFTLDLERRQAKSKGLER